MIKKYLYALKQELKELVPRISGFRFRKLSNLYPGKILLIILKV